MMVYRNPLSIIAAYTDLIDDPATARIIEREIIRIDEMVSTLDQEWIKSKRYSTSSKKHDSKKLILSWSRARDGTQCNST
jgi:hypothetical protein